VLHVARSEDLIQVSLEDSASAISSSATMVAANTPREPHPARALWKVFDRAGALQRFGERSSAGPKRYDPLFSAADLTHSPIVDCWERGASVSAELAQIPSNGSKPAAKSKIARPRKYKDERINS